MFTLCEGKKILTRSNNGDQSETGVLVRTVILLSDLCRGVRGRLTYNKYSTGEQHKLSNFNSFKTHGFTKY